MIPIRTETSVKATPWVNYTLIAVNIVMYLIFDRSPDGPLAQFKNEDLVLHADWPRLHQFFTYQFLHGNLMHLFGNMVFLWVFGNPVCGKMGGLPYLLFYLAGGVFAACGYALGSSNPMLGASGAIAAVTTAYLALFPRSHVTVLFLVFIITTFEIPALVLIVFKVILWDNILMPSFGGQEHVAYSAHLAGYGFGFVATMLMLWWRALPRDTFDMIALWKRWHQRRAFSAALSDPEARARAELGTVARPVGVSGAALPAEDARLDRISELRSRIGEALERGELTSATALHEHLVGLDPPQCLPEKAQLQMARFYYETGRFPQAAAAFERFLACYPRAVDGDDIRLLVGIIYARDLRQYQTAEQYLREALNRIEPGDRRAQCERWLELVRATLGEAPLG